MGLKIWDRITAFFKAKNIATPEKTLYDQTNLEKVSGSLMSGSTRFIIEQTNLSINRLQRYRDYSQMDQVGEMTLALDLYSDESSIVDSERKKSVIIKSKYKIVKEELEHFFGNILNIDRDIRPAARYLCKYGDFAWEILPSENRDGVSAVKFLNIFNFTRVETKGGDLVGFYYQDAADANPQFLHPWQCSHMRLTSYENIFWPYGISMLEGARKSWKQLRLMEDSAIVYRLCLKHDTKIWTNDGHKMIKDIIKNDIVYSYSKEGKLISAKVNYVKNNGTDDILIIKSENHEIHTNKTHPVLIYNEDNIQEYIEAQKLNKFHKVVAPIREGDNNYKFKLPPTSKIYKLKEDCLKIIKTKDMIKLNIEDEISETTITNFLQGKVAVNLEIFKKIKKATGFKNHIVLDKLKEEHGIHIKPDITPEFMKFIGYLMGSVYINKNGLNCVVGLKGKRNDWFIRLFKKYFRKYKTINYNTQTLYCYSNIKNILIETLLLNNIPVNKNTIRVPEWVFASSIDFRKEFIKGILESEISKKENGEYTVRSNALMLESLKLLLLETGYDAKIEEKALFTKLLNRPIYESIISIEESNKAEIYDIGVSTDEHNFVANGIVVHNTRAPEKRVFKIPVGNIAASESDEYMKEQAQKLKKRKFMDQAFNEMSERWNPLIAQDDYFLPVRSDGSGPTVETLAGGANLDEIADIEYFKKKMVSALKIPFNRVGIGEQPSDPQQSLSQVSPEFAKAVQFVQKEIVAGLKKIAFVHLAMRGFNDEQIKHFDIQMTAGSAIDELYRMETWNSRTSVIKGLQDTKMFPDEWILERFTDMTMDEIVENKRIKKEEELSKPKEDTGEGEEGGMLGGLLEGHANLLSRYRDYKKPRRLENFRNDFDRYLINNEFGEMDLKQDTVLNESMIHEKTSDVDILKEEAILRIKLEKEEYYKCLKEDIYYKILNGSEDIDEEINESDIP